MWKGTPASLPLLCVNTKGQMCGRTRWTIHLSVGSSPSCYSINSRAVNWLNSCISKFEQFISKSLHHWAYIIIFIKDHECYVCVIFVLWFRPIKMIETQGVDRSDWLRHKVLTHQIEWDTKCWFWLVRLIETQGVDFDQSDWLKQKVLILTHQIDWDSRCWFWPIRMNETQGVDFD